MGDHGERVGRTVLYTHIYVYPPKRRGVILLLPWYFELIHDLHEQLGVGGIVENDTPDIDHACNEHAVRITLWYG